MKRLDIGNDLDEEEITDWILQYNLLDYKQVYTAIYRKIGPQLMADLLQSIQCRFDKNCRRCHYGI